MNTFRPPPGPPPSYAFVTRMYRRNLRPLVQLVAASGAIWALFSAISSFQELHVEKSQNLPKLAPISIVIGTLYLVATAIETFGVFSACVQRLALVRLYAYGSILVAVIAIGTSLLRTILHFTLKNTLISECTDVATGETISYSWGMWGSSTSQTLSPSEAADWCNSQWSHDSFSEVIVLLIVMFLSILFSVVAWGYYRQLLDPSSPANFIRSPANQVRMGAYPSRYNPPSGTPGNAPNLEYNYPSPYVPPYGASREQDEAFVPPYDEAKLPGYGVGAGADDKVDKRDDPFADGPSMPRETDVTSPSGRGGRGGYDV